jgi:hypothetical protein
LAALALLLLILTSPLAAQETAPLVVPLTINGHLVELDEPALLHDEYLLVSASALVSELGMNIEAVDGGAWRVKAFGQQFILQPDKRGYRLGDQNLQAPTEPLLRGSELFIPVQILLKPLGLTVDHDGAWEIKSSPSGVTSIRQGTHGDRVRYVLDLTQTALFRWYEEPGKLVLELPATPDLQGRSSMMRLHEFSDPMSDQVSESLSNGVLRLVVNHASTEPPEIFTLSDPARIVIDLLREPAECVMPVQAKEPPKPQPGDIWSSHAFVGSRGPVRGFVIRFNPQKTGWKLRPALAATTIMQRSTVSRIASQKGAYGAINGGYFSTLGPPLGMLVVDGEWIKAPLYNRAVLGISKTGQYAIAQTDLNARVEFEGLGFLPLEGLNEGHTSENSVVVYNRRWGPLVAGAAGRTRLVVNDQGIVTLVLTKGEDAVMPSGGFILSGNGLRAQTLAGICQGSKVRLDLQTNPVWPNLLHAIGGGPILVSGGKVCVNGAAERFRNDITIGSRPRSAVGLTANGEVILVAIQNPGVTLKELAGILIKLGACSAMNLDGGGSTAMVVNGKLLNEPGDGCERAVSNALLVVKW